MYSRVISRFGVFGLKMSLVLDKAHRNLRRTFSRKSLRKSQRLSNEKRSDFFWNK